MANKINEEPVNNEAVKSTISKAEQFYEGNKKIILIIFAVIIVAAAAVLCYTKFIYGPQCEEAQAQMFPAENLFKSGDYETALNGDGNVLGFAQIIDEYGAKAGKAVYFYAGVSALQTKKYEEALTYLQKYKVKDPVLGPRAKACEGDAYVGLGEDSYQKAVDCYVKAADMADNMFAASYLLKAGVTYEALGANDKALECYDRIRKFYPMSPEIADALKYIARIEE
ncbi:MAG: tetratricopeptide repeat protein [Bacteroidales bacterium]|nr:tetratricopeptide repeat protein [Bacteroidales bacterium]